MKHIVFVAGSYYPYYSAVGKCLGNIASEFEKDYRVTVICEKNVVGQTDQDLLNTQKIIRVTTGMHARRIRIDDKVKHARGLGRYFWTGMLYLAKLERFVRSALSRSVCDRQVIRAYLEGFSRISEPVDVIIPTCIQFESVAAAMQYQSAHPGVQIIPYLFDLFAENVNLNRGKLLLKRHWKANMEYERQMFEASDFVFHVSNWSGHIRKYFPEYLTKSAEVEHPLLVPDRAAPSIPQDGKIHVVYTGVEDAVIRSPEKTLEVLAGLNDDSICIDFYSFGSGENLVEQFAARSKTIIAHGQVDSGRAARARRNADILLSIGNAVGSFQMPSKLIEYIASGKPILHFMQSAGDPAAALLSRYPLAMVVDLRADIPYRQLEQFIRERAGSVLCFEQVWEMFQDADPEYLEKEITDSFRDRYNLIFAGSLKKGYVDAQYAVDLFSGGLLSRCSLDFYAAGNGVDVLQNAAENIVQKGWIDKARLEKAYQQADAFISIAEKNGRQISSKIFEYMSYGKPIIHIYYVDDDVNLRYLKHYAKALCLKAEMDKIAYNRLMVALFLVGMQNRGQDDQLSDELLQCTPERIACCIQEKIS